MSETTRRVRERVERAGDVLDVCRRLGPGWALFRLRYAAERRVGLHERRSPVADWPEATGLLRSLPDVVHVDGLRTWLNAHASDEQRVESQELVEQLRRREFVVFGQIVELESWHHDPINGVRYDASSHWSKVPEFERVDIKCVWEPSRFGWAFGLVRAEHLGVDGAGDLFWELLASWMNANQPNAGIQWACGQEASIRLMAVSLSAMAMPHTWTSDRLTLLEQLIEVTADRVEANIAYARSQRNNHHASEAIGLIASALMMPAHPHSERWLTVGSKHLEEVVRVLILPDGGSSQYSTNYHRVFLHNFVWIAQLAEAAGHDLGLEFRAAFRRASDYLIAFIEPVSGHGPFIGHDDGAELLPRFFQPHRLLGPDVQLLRACHDLPRAAGPAEWDEWLAWFGLEFGAGETARWPETPGFLHYPDMGMVIMWAGQNRAYVRCGPSEFRPSQADQLHVDVWQNGINTIGDPGTFSYNPARGELGLLDSAFDHNTIVIDGRDHMPKIGRFLFARWAEGWVDAIDVGETVVGRFSASVVGGVITQTVEVSSESVVLGDNSGRQVPGSDLPTKSYRTV